MESFSFFFFKLVLPALWWFLWTCYRTFACLNTCVLLLVNMAFTGVITCLHFFFYTNAVNLTGQPKLVELWSDSNRMLHKKRWVIPIFREYNEHSVYCDSAGMAAFYVDATALMHSTTSPPTWYLMMTKQPIIVGEVIDNNSAQWMVSAATMGDLKQCWKPEGLSVNDFANSICCRQSYTIHSKGSHLSQGNPLGNSILMAKFHCYHKPLK